jgi:hypothetical protein
MVWSPFVKFLGRGGVGFPGDGWAGAGSVVTGVVAKLHLDVPLEVCMADDFAGVKLDAVEWNLRIARGMDAARPGIVDEWVTATVEDE